MCRGPQGIMRAREEGQGEGNYSGVLWNFVSSSPVSITLLANGFSSRFPKFLASNGIRYVIVVYSLCSLTSNSQFTITSAPEDPYVSVHIRVKSATSLGLLAIVSASGCPLLLL
jgi:hypothetical protein